jgi:hypothetical protein
VVFTAKVDGSLVKAERTVVAGDATPVGPAPVPNNDALPPASSAKWL